jgi:putative ABC transport system substrate-binding protein
MSMSRRDMHPSMVATCAEGVQGALLIVGLAFALLLAPLAVFAQPTAKLHRLGVMVYGLDPDGRHRSLDQFRKGLHDLGHVVGHNVALEVRYSEANRGRMAEHAAEPVRLNVEMIVTSTGTAALVAKKTTQTIPIVMWGSADAVGQGLVASLGRPGGNVTGLTVISPELSRKRLEILREMLPKLSLVGVLRCCGGEAPTTDLDWTETQSAAAILGVQLLSLEVASHEDLTSAFVEAAKQRVDGVLLFDIPRLQPGLAQMIELSLKHRLPVMYPFHWFPQAGGLVSYGPDLRDGPYRAAIYVDKILKGAKPADLPVEQPTRFGLTINMKTARALGLTIPRSVLMRADLIE